MDSEKSKPKGKWGGKRANTGGARPGSGPKPRDADQAATRDPLEFLLDVMQGLVTPSPDQIKAATAAAQYVHAKKGEGGKKDEKERDAKVAGQGKFAAGAGPRLVVNNG